uniref:Uncharacterized protein n=1 Tax=Glossina palpalis gambiensis TaxID=67801 RepID=A0A1B0BM27_9MUSC
MPAIEPRDVLLATDCVGISGSDIHHWQEGEIRADVLKPLVLCGAIKRQAITSQLDRANFVAIAKYVDVIVTICARSCNFIRVRLQMVYFKITSHKTPICRKLPDDLTMEEGALYTVGVAAARRAKVKLSSNLLISVAGPIVMAADKEQDRLEMAKAFGSKTTKLGDKDGRECNEAAQNIHIHE